MQIGMQPALMGPPVAMAVPVAGAAEAPAAALGAAGAPPLGAPAPSRWWLDPVQTFGPAANPELVAQAAAAVRRGNEAESAPVANAANAGRCAHGLCCCWGRCCCWGA